MHGPTTALGLFRVLFALALLAEIATSRAKQINALHDGGFHLPYLELLPTFPEWLYHALHDVQVPLLLLLALGILPRLSCGALLAIQGALFFADRLNFRNHPYLFLLLLVLLACSPAGKAFALPAVLRGGGRLRAALVGREGPLTVQRLIQIQIGLVYLLAALHKLHPAYLDGSVLAHLIEQGAIRPLDLSPGLLAAAAVGTVLLELALPFGLWLPRTRPFAIVAGVVFHLAVAHAMQIYTFSAVMIVGYLLFLDPTTLPRLLAPRRSDRLAA